MLGRNTETYRKWKRESARYSSMPQSLDVINLGSSCDENNFDYSLWKLKGFNFASAPQDVYYDNQLLEQYGNRVKSGGVVFISLSEFALIVDKYNIEDHNYKYYWYLDKSRVDNYTEMKQKMLFLCPGLLDRKYLKQEIKTFIKKILHWEKRQVTDKVVSLAAMSQQMLTNWYKEFGWDGEPFLRDEQRLSISRSWELILKDISFCTKHELIPIIVIPPFCDYLKKIIPVDLIEECLWRYINILKERGITIINFWDDSDLTNPDLYVTPIILNEKGKKIFNQKLQEDAINMIENTGIRESLKTANETKKYNDYYILQNDMNLPCIAFGTGVIKRFYRNKKLYYKDTFTDILRSIKHHKLVRRLKNDISINKILDRAIQNGYCIFDTGRLYGHSEQAIGKAISRYHRNDFFLVTKVSADDLKRYSNAPTVSDNLNISLKYLNTDYVDAYLLHFPSGDWLSMYKAMEKEYMNGKVKSLGVCNFDKDELIELINKVTIKPMICQVELNPLNTKKELRQFCQQNGIVVMAHTPTAHMDKRVVESDIFQQLTKKYNKTAAQIIYRWHYQNSVIPIVSTTSDIHLKENMEIFDFELETTEVEKIEDLNQNFSFDKNNNKINDCSEFIYNI